jgi:hypothetical protein
MAIDAFLRYIPMLGAKFSNKGEDVIATLDRTYQRICQAKTTRGNIRFDIKTFYIHQ